MKILVTGASGFTGRYMMEYLSGRKGVDPIGLVRSGPHENPRLPWITADLLDREGLDEKISGICPDAIIHLAGLTHGTLDELRTTNVSGTKNLLDAARFANPKSRVLVISSSAVYGYAGNNPIPESTPLVPLSDYGISKMEQETLALGYNEAGHATISIARLFNLAGPGQSAAFVCGRIVSQIAEIDKGQKTALDLLETRSARDFIDVRDAVKGYFALVTQPDYSGTCAGKTFNMGSGIPSTIAEIIATIEEITGNHYAVRLPAVPPPVPIPTQQSDNARITAITGWKPTIPLRKTLADMLDAVTG